LEFDGQTEILLPGDSVILAVPAPVASQLVPGILAPASFRAIVNAHFKIAPPQDSPKVLCVINALTEWLFSFPDRLSITVSDADRLLECSREALAAAIWREIAAITGIADELPPWQIIKERRAT